MTVPDPVDGTTGGVAARYLAAVAAQDVGAPPDHPAPQGKRYRDAPRWPLRWPGPGAPPLGATGADRLSALLLGYAPRRLELITNTAFATMRGWPSTVPDLARLLPAWFTTRRAVPSGGAFHPAELYVVWAGTADLPPGVYHHDAAHHTLELLRPGDPAAALDHLLGNAAPEPRHALVVACRVVKNAGKYQTFGYQLAMMDSGVLLGQLAGSPLAGRVHLAFDPRVGESLLGLDGDLETVVAVVELPAARLGSAPVAAPGPAAAPLSTAEPLSTAAPLSAGIPLSTAVPASSGLDGDRRNLAEADPAVTALHRAIRTGAAPAPRVAPVDAPAPPTDPAPAPTAGPPVAPPPTGPPPVTPLPPPTGSAPVTPLPPTGSPVALPPPAAPSRAATARRASANDLAPGLTVGQLAGILAYAGGHRAAGALAGLTGHPRHPALWCLVDRVDGLARGAYRYDRERHLLWPSTAHDGAPDRLADRLNAGMSRAGASLFVVAGGDPPVDRLDPVALRDLYLRTGAAAQLAALAAGTVGAATRPMGGFDAAAATTLLGLPAGAVPLLHLLVGAPRPRAGALAVAFTEGSADA
ncbi:nitroreductase family protein [Micromonospora echinospora]|uniref:nitroreductase family protein n=1 Tax=Micromonospora echinospora TaxID=1877 RepID=UPI003671D8D8